MEEKAYLVPNEVADLLMVSPVTVRQWAQKGILRAVTTVGGHRRFARDEVERFARERGLVLQQPARSACRILIADDDEQVRKFLVELLGAQPYAIEIETAVDGFDAGLKLRAFAPQVLLLDLMMPGMDGFTACRQVKSDPLTASIRVIAMTGYHTPENVRRVLEAGAEVCLPKPVTRLALLAAIGPETLARYPRETRASA